MGPRQHEVDVHVLELLSPHGEVATACVLRGAPLGQRAERAERSRQARGGWRAQSLFGRWLDQDCARTVGHRPKRLVCESSVCSRAPRPRGRPSQPRKQSGHPRPRRRDATPFPVPPHLTSAVISKFARMQRDFHDLSIRPAFRRAQAVHPAMALVGGQMGCISKSAPITTGVASGSHSHAAHAAPAPKFYM